MQQKKPDSIDTEKIKHIYDYTKFHIGMYSALLAGLIAVSNSEFGKSHGRILFSIIIILLIGGIAGALAASRIVYGPWQDGSFIITGNKFWEKQNIGTLKISYADISLTVEHYSFWIALAIAIITFALPLAKG